MRALPDAWVFCYARWEIAAVGRPIFPIYVTFAGPTTYERARTYGIDVAFKF
ncbi:MAG TPA: hypothetical protein VJ762_13885 [Sphingobium sp.]|nr:hypothetical protein [Sphingobium sp.]